MNISIKGGLPFTTVAISYKGSKIDIPNVLIDTGSASTIFATDIVETIGIAPMEQEILYTIRGVGGVELVFMRKVDSLDIGNCRIQNFEIEIGGMDYGFDINGILGMDFLSHSGAAIDLRKLTILFETKPGD